MYVSQAKYKRLKGIDLRRLYMRGVDFSVRQIMISSKGPSWPSLKSAKNCPQFVLTRKNVCFAFA